MDYVATILQPIRAEMTQLKAHYEKAVSTDNPLLQAVVEHTLSRGGKQMRPMLTLLMAKLCGRIDTSVYHAAVALELLHTASLMHDDVVDESDLRRGQPSVNSTFDNRTAVLSGDYYLATALCQVSRTRNPHLIDIVARLGQNLADGELLQLVSSHHVASVCSPTTVASVNSLTTDTSINLPTAATYVRGGTAPNLQVETSYHRSVTDCDHILPTHNQSSAHTTFSPITEENYYRIIRKKTASLFGACAQTGALAAGASDEMAEKAHLFGEYIGICFQIKDDIFDYFDSSEIGKPTGNDLREGKLTLPIIHALAICPDATALALAAQVQSGTVSSTEIAHLIDYAKAHGGIDYAACAMYHYRDLALSALQSLPYDEVIHAALTAYANCVVERRK